MRSKLLGGWLTAALALAFAAPALAADVQRLHYKFGPVTVEPGTNLILIAPNLAKPTQDGYVTRIRPDLQRPDGSVPRVDVIHLHHGVWLNNSGSDVTDPGLPERFFASGEEKTIFQLPAGYGYPVKASDTWTMNYMVHNPTTAVENVYITYDIDFVPSASPAAKQIKPVRPVWLDVVNGSNYPVFDVKRGSGGRDGRFTFPYEATKPYRGPPLNEWKVDRDGSLIITAGHVHPGGLWTDLDLQRPGASPTPCRKPASRKRSAGSSRDGKRSAGSSRDGERSAGQSRVRGQSRSRSCVKEVAPNTVRLFRSKAVYYDPNGPVSWDVSMTGTKPDWRVGVRKGDVLKVSATYDAKRASWYESMGIMVAFMSDETAGADPFRTRVDRPGAVTHGHLAENSHHGGDRATLPDPFKFPDGQTLGDRVGIANFGYLPGDLSQSGSLRNPPVVKPGQSLGFDNLDSGGQIYHTVTACKAPCNREAGISYPLADGDVDFDSGELGYGPEGLTAASQRTSWQTPKDLKAGTYTYFCRIHPFMRGAFRVK